MIDELESEIMQLKTEIDRLDFMIYGHNNDDFNRRHYSDKQKKVHELLAMRVRLLELREKQAKINQKF